MGNLEDGGKAIIREALLAGKGHEPQHCGCEGICQNIGHNNTEAHIDRKHCRYVQETDRPKIVCLCGSTRFYKEFQRANYDETMAGRIVLSVGFYMHAATDAHSEDRARRHVRIASCLQIADPTHQGCSFRQS